MKGTIWTKVAGLLVVAVLILTMTAHQVRFTETAVVTRFDRVVNVIQPEQAGLKFTWPWPIERVRKFDARLRSFDTEFTQLSTEDQKTITAAAFATWRIANAEQFLRSVGREEAAADKIGDLLKNQISTVLRRHPLTELVNTDPSRMKLAEIEAEIRDGIRDEAMNVFGISVASVGLKRLGLPQSNTREVFERMKADRKKEIDALVAEGDAKADEIRSNAKTMADKILSRAEAYAKKLRAEGDAKAAQFYPEFQKAPEFSRFLQNIDALKTMLESGKTTIVLDTTVFEPLELLRDPSKPESGGSN